MQTLLYVCLPFCSFSTSWYTLVITELHIGKAFEFPIMHSAPDTISTHVQLLAVLVHAHWFFVLDF